MIFKGYPGGTQAEGRHPGSGNLPGSGVQYPTSSLLNPAKGYTCQDTGLEGSNARIHDERMHRTEDRG